MSARQAARQAQATSMKHMVMPSGTDRPTQWGPRLTTKSSMPAAAAVGPTINNSSRLPTEARPWCNCISAPSPTYTVASAIPTPTAAPTGIDGRS